MIDQDLSRELRDQLQAERQRLEIEIANLSSSGTRGDTFNTDEMFDVVDQHPADEGSELFEREKNLTLQRTLQGSLELVNQALARMDHGTYGTCDNCGRPIAEKRLRALPEAQYCIECQSKLEHARH